MSKTAVKKLHWRSNVQDSFVPLLGPSGELGVAVGGGADYGEFPFVTAAPGGGLTVGDIVLEIGGTPVLGMTLGDVRGVLNSCPHPIRIKTVSPGKAGPPGAPAGNNTPLMVISQGSACYTNVPLNSSQQLPPPPPPPSLFALVH